jgi:DnaJ-class molecular chaperone
MSKDPYAALGVAKNATADAIKKAYRKLAKELHPDRTKDNPKATERFKSVSSAYTLLSDAETRSKYDRGEIDGDGNPKGFDPRSGFGGGQRGGPQGGFRPGSAGGFEMGGDMGDIFADLFNFGGRSGTAGAGPGGHRPPPPKGASIDYRVTIPFEDAALAKPQRLTMQNGKTIDLKIPAGFTDGQQMKLAGMGASGAGGPGDGLITLKTGSHPHFTRVGDDVKLELTIGLREAVLGAKVKAATVDGSVMVSVPTGASSGKTLRLRGKGFTRKDGSRGDQLVTLMIAIPENDPALKAFAESWTVAAE